MAFRSIPTNCFDKFRIVPEQRTEEFCCALLIVIRTEAMLDTEVLQFDAVQTRKKINNPSAFGTDEEVDGVEITYVFNPSTLLKLTVMDCTDNIF